MRSLFRSLFSVLCARSLHVHEVQRHGFFQLRNAMLTGQVLTTP